MPEINFRPVKFNITKTFIKKCQQLRRYKGQNLTALFGTGKVMQNIDF